MAAKIRLKELLKRRFQFDRIGYSSRATEFEAALGLAQLDDLQENISKRQEVALRLRNALCEFVDLTLPQIYYFGDRHTFMMFPIVLRETSSVDKYDLCAALEKHGIETRDMMPITNQPCYKEFFIDSTYSVASWINKNGFYIPCTPAMTPQDIERIHKSFARYLDKK